MTPRLRGRLWVSVAEHCAETGETPSAVRKQLREGRLRGRDLNAESGKRPQWQVLASETRRRKRELERG